MEEIKDKILEEYKKGNIVVAGIEGLQVMPIKEFIKQPTEGMLYDLNRNEAVVLTFLPDPKWVNDYAVAKVITELKNIIKATEEVLTIPVVSWRSEQLPDFDVQEINDILKECKENKDSLQTLIGRIWNKGYGEGVCYD
ncbi:MAG: hypothetical protein GY739_14455, partial [Mesoflavibacter sp.]|nr:hypothetical protein [Mesoflavibacter sp.]